MKATWLLLAGAVCALAPHSAAQCPEAGSLLVFPEFDNIGGTTTLFTITNTNPEEAITVEIIYLDWYDCSEFNREIELTPNDTFTFLTRFHNPEHEKGYAYAFAKNEDGEAVCFDWLVGHTLRVESFATVSSGMNPFVFKCGGSEGDATDVDGDGVLDLDGTEYEQAPDEIIIPRFLGQSGKVTSKLLLIDMTGTQFTTTVDLLIYNDNEEVFSSEYTFECMKKVELTDISGIFSNDFLKLNTNQDPLEVWGAPQLESGWIWINGAVASSSTTSIADPAVLAVLDEGLMGRRGRSLPFCRGEQDNGALLPRNNDGDQD